jgi:hypothetical protein
MISQIIDRGKLKALINPAGRRRHFFLCLGFPRILPRGQHGSQLGHLRQLPAIIPVGQHSRWLGDEPDPRDLLTP